MRGSGEGPDGGGLLETVHMEPTRHPLRTGPGEPPRPLVKVCGITRPRDGVAAVELGADLVGLNFHPPSPRCLDLRQATEIAAGVRAAAASRGRPAPLLVGVFVDLPRERIEALDAALHLDLLQFHGDQGPEDVAPWGGRAVVVVRVPKTGAPSAEALGRRLEAYRDAWGFLFDVRHGDLYGGTGETFGWSLLSGLDRQRLGRRPLLVAGGIAPNNVRRALVDSGADGVDVASGVESSPGVKDRHSIQRLIQEVRDVRSSRPTP